MKLQTLFQLILIIISFLYFSLSLLLFDPPIWPDEAIFSDISRNLYQEHRLGTNLWQGLIEGAEQHVYWMPPLFLYINTIFLAATGFSIINQRLLIVFLSVAFLISLRFLLNQFIQTKRNALNQFLPELILLLFITDPTFLKASRLGRPEMLALALVFPGLLCFVRILNNDFSKKSDTLLFLSGLLLGLATITHLMAISFAIPMILSLAFKKKLGLYKFRGFFLWTIGFLLPVSLWLISVFPNYQLLKLQLMLVGENRMVSDSWMNMVWNFLPIQERIIYLIYFFVSLFFVFFAFKNRSKIYSFLAFSLISVWFFAVIGKIESYPVFFIPLTFIALAILFKNTSSFLFKIITIITMLTLLACNLLIYFRNYNGNLRTDQSYKLMSDEIIKTVPEGKTVLLSSIPDPYFVFKPLRNKLHEFPALKTSIQNYKKVLDETDFVIFTAFLGHPSVAPYLNEYVSKNLQSVKQIDLPNGMTILVVELKNIRDRKN